MKASSAETGHAGLHPEPATAYYGERIDLPGFDDCREDQNYTPVGFCSEGHVQLGKSSCGRRGCSDHWTDSARNATAALVSRLAAFRHAAQGSGRRFAHVVASPPQDRTYSTDQFWKARSDAYEPLGDAGVRGGVVIPHPYRTTEEADRLFADAKDAGIAGEDTGKWEFLRGQADGDMSRYTEPSPHFHVLAPERYVDGEAAPDDWIVTNVNSGEGEPFDMDNEKYLKEMIAPAMYTLTHAGVQKGRQTITYFGEVHPASFDPEAELDPETWDEIQSKVDGLLGIEGGKGHSQLEPAADTCQCEECEATALPLRKLPDWMADADWKRRIRRKTDGRHLLAELRGAKMFHLGTIDRPPPHRDTPEWLREKANPLSQTPADTGDVAGV